MNEVMKQVNELMDTLIAKNKEADALAERQKITGEGQEATAVAQEQKKEELSARELKIEKVESAVVLRQQIADKIRDLEQRREKFGVEKDAYAILVAEKTKFFSEQQADIKSQLETIKEKEKKFTAEQSTGLKSELEKLIARTPKLSKEDKGAILKELVGDLGKK